MTTQRRPAPTGGDPKRRPTTRLPGAAAGTGRHLPPAAPKKKNLPLIVGGAIGAFALVLIIVVVASTGGGAPGAEEPLRPKAAEAAKPKGPPPGLLALEAEARDKCERGANTVEPRLAPDPSANKENRRRDLETGLQLLREGLAAFKKAADLSGKSYATRDFVRARDRGLKAYCDDVEREAQNACDQGLKLVQATEQMMTSKETLTDEDKKKLKGELERAKKLIEEGMNLFDRAYQVADQRFDTNKYGQALKMTRAKLLELR